MERCAIVGGGLAGFVAYTTLRHLGLEPGAIVVYGTDPDPVGAWRPRAESIRQRAMRSESDGHCFPRSFPGLAAREAARRRTIRPLLDSVTNRYRPTLAEFVAHVGGLREASGWDESFRLHSVARVRAVAGGFELDGEGPFPHALLAPGHPGLAYPAGLAGDARVVHAYEPHDYEESVAIVGTGMAAATEWLNALAAGSSVLSVRRREPTRRPLNVDRPLFSKRGLARYQATPPAVRAGILSELSVASYPPGRAWDEPVESARRDGRFRVSPTLDGAAQVICATGFLRGFRHDPLLADLVEAHGLEAIDRWIVLDEDCRIPALSDGERTLAVAGAPAQWAYPAADTLVGMKFAARRFARRATCRTR
jgi:cation diffusion facilitator CzcD-associated flavoprotein CzcO